MVSVFGVEWVSTYIPIAISLLDVFKSQVLGGKHRLTEEENSFVSQTTGFVDESGSVIRGGKKRKSQTRKDDQKALSQLQQISDVSQARYRFVSDNFMRRHALGPYAGASASASAVSEVEESEEKALYSEESDDWVVEALTQKSPEESIVDTSVGVSYGTDGASLSVGVEFDFGRKSSRRKRPSISQVAKQANVPPKSKQSGPRVSDRESGVMGRLRAAGANSLVGRSLLGAYPGDVPAPYDAADANGMFNLAMKYGYGDWSDDDIEFAKRSAPRRRRKKTSSGGSRTRERGSNQIGIGFELGSSSSSSKSNRSTPRYKTKSTSGAQADAKPEKARTIKKRRSTSAESENVESSAVVGPALDQIKKKAEEQASRGSSILAKGGKGVKASQQELQNKGSVVGPAMDAMKKRSASEFESGS